MLDYKVYKEKTNHKQAKKLNTYPNGHLNQKYLTLIIQ